jgi:hypothetical protein
MKKDTIDPTSEHYEFSSEDEIDLKEIFHKIWRHRIGILASTLIFVCLVGLAVAPMVLKSRKTVTRLKFELNFAGVDHNKYPNGMRFTTRDIIAPLILERVYADQELEQYITLPDFRDSISVFKSNDGLQFLEATYTRLLENRTLTGEERNRLQEEYLQKKSKLLDHNAYNLIFDDLEMNVPEDVQVQSLASILDQWARFTQDKRGVHLFQVPLITPNLFDFNGEGEEYIVQIDMLRRRTADLLDNIEKVLALPGALLVRTDDDLNLTTLKMEVADLIRYTISPLANLVRQGQIYNSKRMAKIYLEEQIYNLELENREQQGGLDLLRESLKGYMAVGSDEQHAEAFKGNQETLSRSTLIPQIGDNFLDRLVALANENQDVKYRQDITQKIVLLGQKQLKTKRDIAYYKDLLPRKDNEDISLQEKKALQTIFIQKREKALRECKRIASTMNDLYQIISRDNLRAEQNFYTSTNVPEFKTLSIYSLKKMLAVCIGAIFLFFTMACTIALLRDRTS